VACKGLQVLMRADSWMEFAKVRLANRAFAWETGYQLVPEIRRKVDQCHVDTFDIFGPSPPLRYAK
jgi:hypothetical protein